MRRVEEVSKQPRHKVAKTETEVVKAIRSSEYQQSQTVVVIPDYRQLPGVNVTGALKGEATFRSVLAPDEDDTIVNVQYPTLEEVIQKLIYLKNVKIRIIDYLTFNIHMCTYKYVVCE